MTCVPARACLLAWWCILASTNRVDVDEHSVSIEEAVALTGSDTIEEAVTLAGSGTNEEAVALAGSDAISNSSTLLGAGSVMRGRYVLIEHHSRQHWPKGQFPTVSAMKDFTQPVYLGAGSFKDCWKALDKKTNQEVIVALFYHQNNYLTKQAASARGLHQDIEKAKDECVKVIDILKEAKQQNLESGANRICACKAEHVSDASKTDPLFIVMENCGLTLDKIFLKDNEYFNKDADWVRKVMQGVLEGVDFLNKLSQRRVHHDIKMGNIAQVNGEAKLIDFGALVKFPQDINARVECTPGYVPPEVVRTGAVFDTKSPSFAFDTYSTGGTWYALLCRQEPPQNPYEWRLDRRCNRNTMRGSTQRDFELIQGLTAMNANYRLSPARALQVLEGGQQVKPSEWQPQPEVQPSIRYQGVKCTQLSVDKVLVASPHLVNMPPHYIVTVRANLPQKCGPVPSFSPQVHCTMTCQSPALSAAVYPAQSMSTGFFNKFVFFVARNVRNCRFQAAGLYSAGIADFI